MHEALLLETSAHQPHTRVEGASRTNHSADITIWIHSQIWHYIYTHLNLFDCAVGLVHFSNRQVVREGYECVVGGNVHLWRLHPLELAQQQSEHLQGEVGVGIYKHPFVYIYIYIYICQSIDIYIYSYLGGINFSSSPSNSVGVNIYIYIYGGGVSIYLSVYLYLYIYKLIVNSSNIPSNS